MLREATPEDAAAIDAFLTPYTETSMFLRGNLASHGVGWTDARHSTRFWLWEEGGMQGVFGLTKAGFMMIQLPDLNPAANAAFAREVAGHSIAGISGAADQVARLLSALRLEDAAFSLLRDEPLYRMALADLPVNTEATRPPVASDIPMLERWLTEYMLDTETAPSRAVAEEQAKPRAAAAPGSSMRLLLQDGMSVAMAALNAQVDGTVQVGGVYVPREMRNRGLGRKMVIALLSDAMANGARDAILFAASEAAAHVYEAVGFHKIGTYKLALLAAPVDITPV